MKCPIPEEEWDFRRALAATEKTEYWSMVDYEYFREIPELVRSFSDWKRQPFPTWTIGDNGVLFDEECPQTVGDILPNGGLCDLPDKVFERLLETFPEPFRKNDSIFRTLASWKSFPNLWRGTLKGFWKRSSSGRALHIVPMSAALRHRDFPPEARLATSSGDVFCLFMRRDLASPQELKNMFSEWLETLPKVRLLQDPRGNKSPKPWLKWLSALRLRNAGVSFQDAQEFASKRSDPGNPFNDVLPIYSGAGGKPHRKGWDADISKAAKDISKIRALLLSGAGL